MPTISRRQSPTAADGLRLEARRAGLASANGPRTGGLIVCVVILGAAVVLSLGVGARDIALPTVWAALTQFDPANDEHLIVLQLRVPRTVTALVVGPALGMCGALIQAFTRNPLADPGILGVNAGASFAVTIAVGVFGVAAPWGYVWFALCGAAGATVLVYMLGSLGHRQADPIRLTLAGVAISAALGGVTTALTLANRDAFQDLRFWGVGSVGGRDLGVVVGLSWLIVGGLVLSLAMSRSLNALALGDELATSLGVRTGTVRVGVIVAVTLLAGTATALAGPIAFVGLMVPHVVRWFVGPDQRWIALYTLVCGPILLLLADVVGRIILPNGELRVGLVTAIIGAPVLILLARRRMASGL